MKDEHFDAVFIGSGAGLPKFMNIPGENLCGVVSANEFLTRNNLLFAYKEGFETPNFVGKKVAVVAYTGSGSGEDSPYNHGLAIALDDATTAAWCSQKANTCLDAQATNLASALTTLNGLTATAQLVADDSHTHAAATAARNYCYDVSASAGAHPTGTSTWFLPSLGQWNIMLKAMTGSGVDLSSSSNATYQAANVSPLITAAGGTALSAAHYWSSTEKSATDAWDVTFQSGRSNGADKDTGTHHVRAVLAF